MRRTSAVGDSLAASVVADKLDKAGFMVTYQSHPHNHCVLRRRESIAEVEEPTSLPHIDLDGAYETHPQRRTRHFSEIFLERANESLRAIGIDLGPAFNCKPKLTVRNEEKAAFVALLEGRNHPRPWIFICPKSNSYNVREVPNYIWAELARNIIGGGTCFWLGTQPAPPPIVDLSVRHLDTVILWLACADLLVSVDTGPLHIGAALGVPAVAILQSSSPDLHLSDQCDFVSVPAGNLDCLNCQDNVCRKGASLPPCQLVDPKVLSAWVNARLASTNGSAVTAVIAIYRPDAAILNRCLQCVLPQVAEVIICWDTAGVLPAGVIRDEKIRFVQKPAHDIGYGRKANFGARHANGRYLLFLNDDVYLEPDAVQKLKAAMGPKVGVVAPLLRFNDGRIQHAGMVRDGNGGVGFGHIDYGQFLPTFTTEREVECVTGACVLVDRKAFYQVDGMNEDYYLYCEDTDFMMCIRQAGWKILYAPQAGGIHDEHLSTGKTPNIIQHMQRSNQFFGQRWAWYFQRNRGNSGLGVFA